MTRRSAPPPRPRIATPAPPRRSAPPPPRRAPKAAPPKARAPKAAPPKARAPKAAPPKAAPRTSPRPAPKSNPVPRAAAPKVRKQSKAETSITEASPAHTQQNVAASADKEFRKLRAAEARGRVEQAKQQPRRPSRLEIHPGDTVAQRYVVKRVLGRSRGLLIEANHAHFQQRLAVRIISTAYATDAKAVQRFHRETRILSQLESQHVARIADAGTLEDGSLFLAREYLEGESFDVIGKRGLAVSEAVDLFLQVCEAVQEAHARGVVLRDLQPSHVFVTRKRNGEPVAKITDFGTCKVMRDPAAAVEGSCTRLMGLSPSASPELIRQQSDIDERADVWSLGCMFYELLTGHPAFSGDGTSLMLAIAQDEPLPPSSLRRDVDIPQAIDRAVFGALSKRRSDRPARVFDFALALRPFASSRGQVHLEQIARLAGEVLAPYRAPEDSLDDSMTMVRNLRHSEPGPAPAPSTPTAIKAGPLPVPPVPSSTPSVPPMRAAATSAPTLPPGPSQHPSLPPMASLPSYPDLRRPNRRAKLALALVPLAAAAVAIFATVALTPGEPMRAQAAVPRFSLPMTPGADEEPTIAAESADDLQDAPPATEKKAPAAETTAIAEAPAAVPARSRFLDASQRAKAKSARKAKAKESVTSAPKGEKGTLVAMAIGASCAFTVDGAGMGTRSSVRKKVAPGAHTVSCTKVGGTTRTRTVNVTPGKAAVAVFKF